MIPPETDPESPPAPDPVAATGPGTAATPEAAPEAMPGSEAAPRLLCVILNYRTPELTLRAAAAALVDIAALGGEIVIVDNGSGDGSYEALRDAARDRGWIGSGRVRVVQAGQNGGFGAGMNFGMRCGMADGGRPDFIHLLNSDAFPEPGAIRALVDYLRATPQAGMVGSFIHGLDGRPHHTAFRFPSIPGEFETGARTGPITRALARWVVAPAIPQAPTRVDWTAGASLMLRQRMLDRIGGFDEGYFLYFEETDLCLRAARAGWQTHYLPQSRVAHVGSASTGMGRWARMPGYWFDSRWRYFAKNHGRLQAALATLARLAGGLVWQARRLVQRRPQADPDRFLRDLAWHFLTHAWRAPPAAPPAAPPGAVAPKTAATPVSPPVPLCEDRK